jgi:hypothetical protein
MNTPTSNFPQMKSRGGVGDIRVICEALQGQFAGKLFDLLVGAEGIETRLLNRGLIPPADPKPVYDIGCIQTLVDGLVMNALAKNGRIDVDAPLGWYLPELNTAGSRPGLRICVRHLLAHATGYHASNGVPEKAGVGSWDELVDYLAYTEPSFPAGIVCSWNGLGKTILKPLLERVVSLPYDELVKREIGEMIGREPRILNMETGWPAFMVGIDDLVAYVHVALSSTNFAALLKRTMVPVVRNPVASRSVNPIGYALGLALYPEGLWGQTGNGANYNLGLRFDLERSFCAALSIGAPAFARDLVLRYLSAARGFTRSNFEDHIVGTILGCALQDIEGRYFGDKGDVISVAVESPRVTCAYSRNGAHVATISLTLRDDEMLVSDGRWDSNQIEFCKLAETDQLILTLGQIAYVKQEGC